MTLSYHNCGHIKESHKPEINCKVRTLKEVKQISLRHPKTKMYVNWGLRNAYIIENGIITYNKQKEK